MIEPRHAVIVITGASSGIGRATAEAFAAQGATLVIAARRPEALEIAAESCRQRGAKHVLAVPTDVTDAEAMDRLAKAALQLHGRIDVWINNAGVGLFGPFVNARMELHRRVIETNLIGSMNGAAAVLPHFLQRRRGMLIHTISMAGWAPAPFAAAYTASKFGLRGFAAALRQELVDHPEIHVCGVFPAMIDTPGFEHGANVSGHELRPGRFIHPPEQVAEAILELTRTPRAEVAVGIEARVGQVLYGLAPHLGETISARVLGSASASQPPAPMTDGNLLEPLPQGRTTRGRLLDTRRREREEQRPGLVLTLVGLTGAALMAGARYWRPSPRRVRPVSGPEARSARSAGSRRR